MNSGPAVSETFSRDDHLPRSAEGFEECYASGVRVSGRHVQVFVLAAAADGRPRLGISVPRRVGTSVTRNRVRRRLREIFRRSRDLFARAPATVVVNARPSAAGAEFADLAEDYRSAVTRALSRIPRR